mgnify:CR=1 FL=1
MAGPGNTPYQVGPGGDTDIVIPGSVAFYGGSPVAKPTVVALAPATTNLSSYCNALHVTLSSLVGGLKAQSLITTA